METPIEREVSPKVKVPALVLAVLGGALVVASFVVEGADDLAEIGLAVLGASGVAGVTGYETTDHRVNALLDYYRRGGTELPEPGEAVDAGSGGPFDHAA